MDLLERRVTSVHVWPKSALVSDSPLFQLDACEREPALAAWPMGCVRRVSS
jgi:hypothetical protein